MVPTAQGERALAFGDRLYFLRNDRALGVKNGTLGTVRGIAGTTEAGDLALSVQLDGPEGAGTGWTVSVRVADYDALDHGYAATIHKSQGVTVDRAHLLATGSMDRHGAYVALSRHRDSVAVHWARDDVGSRDGLVARLSRERLKDTTLDYAPGFIEAKDAATDEGRFRGRRGIVAEPAPVDLAHEIEDGRARFRSRRRAHQDARAAARQQRLDAEALLPRWDRIEGLWQRARAQPLDERSATTAEREGLAFADTLQARPDLVTVLRAVRVEIGLMARRVLDGAVRQASPAEAVRQWVGGCMDSLAQRRAEVQRAMAQAAAQAALERSVREKQEREQARARAARRPRGPGMGM